MIYFLKFGVKNNELNQNKSKGSSYSLGALVFDTPNFVLSFFVLNVGFFAIFIGKTR